jgi:hypothetical protein
MAQSENAQTATEPPSRNGGTSEETLPTGSSRRLPFILRVATTWTNKNDLPSAEDGQLRYWRQAPLTGTVVTTSGGKDASFSDLEVE